MIGKIIYAYIMHDVILRHTMLVYLMYYNLLSLYNYIKFIKLYSLFKMGKCQYDKNIYNYLL